MLDEQSALSHRNCGIELYKILQYEKCQRSSTHTCIYTQMHTMSTTSTFIITYKFKKKWTSKTFAVSTYTKRQYLYYLAAEINHVKCIDGPRFLYQLSLSWSCHYNKLSRWNKIHQRRKTILRKLLTVF